MKILKPNEIGKGILIEYDAGHISMKNAVDNDFVNVSMMKSRLFLERSIMKRMVA